MSTDFMLDLETYGTSPGSVILSIGAVVFTPDGPGEARFHAVINREASVRAGLSEDPSTRSWWANQSAEARRTLDQANDPTLSELPEAALGRFADWLAEVQPRPKERLIWGNGADFDNVLLIAAYQKFGLPVPWAFFNHRCYRTLKSLAPQVRMERRGIHHNALDDAISQAAAAAKMLKVLRGTPQP